MAQFTENSEAECGSNNRQIHLDDIFCDIYSHLINTEDPTLQKDDSIVISLTSYPARIHAVSQTIQTLLDQTLKADKVVLWLAPEQFPNKEADLPKNLLDLLHKGLIIDWYHDIRSYKKLIPALKKYPNSIIVTADDDIIYPKNWLENLYREYLTDKNTIWCHRAHRIRFRWGKLMPYKNWAFNITKNTPSYLNFCTTGGGVLFPAHCFYSDVLDEKKFMSLSPDADDIWFWSMLLMNNKKINIISENMKLLSLIKGTQKTALWHRNLENGKNNVQLQNILKQYPSILKLLKKEKHKGILGFFRHFY